MSIETKVFTAKAQEQKKAPVALTKGGYVVPVVADTYYGENAQMRELRLKGYVGTLAYYDSSSIGCIVTFQGNAVNQDQMSFNFSTKSLKAVSAEEAQEILKRMAKDFEVKRAEALQKVKDKVSCKRVSVEEREIPELISAKNYLDTNFNYIKMCTAVNESKEPSAGISVHAAARCCSLTKTPQNILVHIPKEWLNYYGYNLVDLKMWLAFLHEVGTGFKATLLSDSTMGESFGASIRDSIPMFDNNNLYMLKEMPCYRIMLETTNNSMQNYMNFIMIRYIYNMQYWTLPTAAMQIKKALGDKITHWEALLVAHMTQDYYGYYCLVSNANNSAIATPDGVTNTQRGVIERIASGSMNSSFGYSRINISNVRKAIREKDYETIYKAIVDWRPKTK